MPDRPTTTPELAAAIRALLDLVTSHDRDELLDMLNEPHRSLLRVMLDADQPATPRAICGNVGYMGPGVRGFLVCQLEPGHNDVLRHRQGEWSWATGEVAAPDREVEP